jgi:MoaA/NifB/PqqE/SkfB family radical SAM enzyme
MAKSQHDAASPVRPHRQSSQTVEPKYTGMTQSPHVLHIPTGNSCNNRCTFCMERNEGYPHRHTLEQYLRDLDRQRDELNDVLFTGGEPTSNPLLPQLVSAAAERSYRVIGLITNGRALARRALCEDLLTRGVNQITVSIHGATAEVHDAITRRRGSFRQALGGLENLTALRPDHPFAFFVNCTLVKANLASIRQLRELVLGFGVDNVNFNVVEPRGTADELFESTVPRYREVMEAADASGLDFRAAEQSLSRIPACVGGGQWVQEFWHLAHHDGVDVYDPEDGKVKGPVCERCAITHICPGIWERYVAGYGWEECIALVDPTERRGQTLRVLSDSDCNNHCIHCVDGPAAHLSKAGVASPGRPSGLGIALRQGWLRGFRRVEIAGGEPLMNDALAAMVRQARSIGFTEVAVETNGRILNLRERFDELITLGLDEVVVRLNAGDPGVHDAMARAGQAHRQTLRGMLQLARRGIPFAVRMRLHPDNRATVPAAREIARRLGARRFESV